MLAVPGRILAVPSRMLAVPGRILAIGRGRGSVLSRHSTVSSVTHPQLTITQLSGLVTSQRREIASARNFITGGGLGSPLMACVAARLATIATMDLRSQRVHIHPSAPPTTTLTKLI